MPPKRLTEVPLFSPDSHRCSHRKKKAPPCSSSAPRTTVNCFLSSSNPFLPIDPSSPESPVKVPRHPFSRKGTRLAKPVCTEDVVRPKKRVTFDLSSNSFGPVFTPFSETSPPQSSSRVMPESDPLPFG